jgi:hypothetical protein
MDRGIESNQTCEWTSHAYHESHTTGHPAVGVVKLDKWAATFSDWGQNPNRNEDDNADDMNKDEDAFHHGESSGKDGIAQDGN